jgi:hypothetical protein
LGNRIPCGCQESKKLKLKGLTTTSAYQKVLQSAIMRISDWILSLKNPLCLVNPNNERNLTPCVLAVGFSHLDPWCRSLTGKESLKGEEKAGGKKGKSQTTKSRLSANGI